MPVYATKLVVEHDDRLVVAKNRRVRWSEPSDVTVWPEVDYIDVDAGFPIQRLEVEAPGVLRVVTGEGAGVGRHWSRKDFLILNIGAKNMTVVEVPAK